MAPDDVAIIIAKLAVVTQELHDFKESHEKMAVERQKNLETQIKGLYQNCIGMKNKARIDTLYIWGIIITFFVAILLALHGIDFSKLAPINM